MVAEVNRNERCLITRFRSTVRTTALLMRFCERSKLKSPFSKTSPSILSKHRKNKEVAKFVTAGFSWPTALDAAADVYNGVRPSNAASGRI